MEAGKLIELSLGQEPESFALSITIHLTNPKGEEAARGVTGNQTCTPAPIAPEAAPASCEEDPQDSQQLGAELAYFRQVSQEIYEGLGKLSKDINLSIQDLSLAENIRRFMTPN